MLKLSRWALCAALCIGSLEIIAVSQAKPASDQKPSAADQPAIIKELNTSTRFENDGSSTQTVSERIQVQNEAGIRLFGIITFSFTVGQNFSLDKMEVHKKDGSIIKAGAENVQETTPQISHVAPMYSDLREKQVTVPGLSVGDEIALQYTIKDTGLIANQFWFQYSFSREAIVLSETVQVDIPRGREVHVSFQPEYKPEIKTIGERTVYNWHSANEKIQEKVKNAAHDAATGTLPPPAVELSTFQNWEQIGSWYYGLQHDRATPDASVKAKAAELTKGLDTREAKIKALYQFVSLNFRYISLDFGIGRYQPHAAGEVLANKYGDCKDKHTLLAALLDAAGIPAYPALVSSSRKIDPDVPSPAQFDHVITVVPTGKDYLFLDTTPEIAPYGLLLLPLRNKRVLLVTGSTDSHFVETPADLPFTAQEIFDLQGKINESGTLEAEVNLLIRGDNEVVIKGIFRQTPPSKYQDLVQGMSYYQGFVGEVSQVKVEGMESLDEAVKISYHYHRPDYFDLHDATPKHSPPLGPISLPEWDPQDAVLLLNGSTGEVIHKCKIELPAGVSIQAPLDVKLDRDYLKYQSTYSAQKNIFTAERRVSILSPEIRNESLREGYSALKKALTADDAQNMLLRLPEGFVANNSNAAGSSDLDELVRQGDVEFREHEFTNAYADFHKVAEKDPTRKEIWRKVALAELGLQHYTDAVLDFLKAIQADPYDAEAHMQLGVAYIYIKKPDLAIPELKKALEIDPLSYRAHYFLGWQYSAQHDPANAVAELEKAQTLGTDDFEGLNMRVQKILANNYFRLKKFDKGLQSIKYVVEAAPNPTVWNQAAYMLAENDQSLDLAHGYADSALKNLYDRANQLDPGSIRSEDINLMSQLAATWDTMGWIYFKQGRFELAEKYVHAAWMLTQRNEIGEHLGEIYEKLKDNLHAVRFYAMSAQPTLWGHTAGPDKSRDHLIAMIGAIRADKLIDTERGTPSQMRTIHLGDVAPGGTKGQFYFVFTPATKNVSIQLNAGDNSLLEPLRKQTEKIAAAVLFPENAPQKLLREGFVMCSAYSHACDLVFNINNLPSGSSTSTEFQQ